MREGVDHTWRQISRCRLVIALNYVCGYFVLKDSDGLLLHLKVKINSSTFKSHVFIREIEDLYFCTLYNWLLLCNNQNKQH